ncbi:hypothetical protein D3C74_493470 [compost metagenome]
MLTPEEQAREGELQLLELRMAGLMSREAAETEAEDRELLQEILTVRQAIRDKIKEN